MKSKTQSKYGIYPSSKYIQEAHARQRFLKFVKNIWFVFDKIRVYAFHTLFQGSQPRNNT